MDSLELLNIPQLLESHICYLVVHHILCVVRLVTYRSSTSMAALCLAVLAGLSRIEDPYANFHNIFEGSSSSLNSLATGLVENKLRLHRRQNAFNVLGEVRG